MFALHSWGALSSPKVRYSEYWIRVRIRIRFRIRVRVRIRIRVRVRDRVLFGLANPF